MLSLAAYRYRNVFSRQGGPIASVDVGSFSVYGAQVFQANARLVAPYARRGRQFELYSNADGTGTHASPMVARHIAISEAIERWAYYTLSVKSDFGDFGFEVDPTSSGMAAYPGLLQRQARTRAFHEAIERYSIIAWWEGLLPATLKETEWSGVQAAVIACPGDLGVTVIMYRRADLGYYAYGHAAGANFREACERAIVELARNEFVLKAYWLINKQPTTGSAVSQLLERRCLYFSTGEGHEKFLSRLHAGSADSAPKLEMVFDGNLPGPWSEYACVWRTVFRPPSDQFLCADDAYFFW